MKWLYTLAFLGLSLAPAAGGDVDDAAPPANTEAVPQVEETDDDPDAEAGPEKPNLTRLSETRYRIGNDDPEKWVEFDSATREIHFPATVNMDLGMLEFAIVHVNGKIHESLFATEVSPTHLNLAFTLLRYQPSHELYFLPNETGGLSDQLPDVPKDVRMASRVLIEVEWTDEEGRKQRHPINEWIFNERFSAQMPDAPWIYGGSEFFNGRYVPEMTGDIAAIDVRNSSMINYSGKDNRNDTVWIARQGIVPVAGTKTTLIIAPYETPTEPAPPGDGAPSTTETVTPNPEKS